MGGLSIWHWLILLVMLGVPLAIIALVVWLATRASKRRIG